MIVQHDRLGAAASVAAYAFMIDLLWFGGRLIGPGLLLLEGSRFLSDPIGIIERMFGVVVDRFETVFDPDDGFDWFELSLAEALVAQMDGWEIDDRAGPVSLDSALVPTSRDLTVAGLAPVQPDGWKSMDGAVARLDTWWRLVSHMQARSFQATWDVVEAYRELGIGDGEELWENVSNELRAALNLTRFSADRLVDLARSLVLRLPMVLDGLGAGRIDLRRAMVLPMGPPGCRRRTPACCAIG